MTILSRKLATALFAAALGLISCLPALGEDTSPWVQGLHSRVRLLNGGLDEGGRTRLAGIAIELDGGFKTYWRHSGESGLPPTFDWSGSENLALVEVLWPAPSRLDDAGGSAYGYQNGVLLPVRLTPSDPAKPVRLSLKIDYGVCKDICIPASAALKLELGPEESGHRAAIADALARVPRPSPLGAPGDLSIIAVAPQTAVGKPMIAVSVRAPRNATLFVEAPDNWYLASGPLQPATQSGAGARFLVEVLERPRQAAGRLDLRLTLVAGDRAIETGASLDLASLPR